MLLFKSIFIKRFNLPIIACVGDLIFDGTIISVRYRWKTVIHTFDQIQKIRAYTLTNWGLVDFEQIDISFNENYKISLDGGITEHQDFIEALLKKLGNKNETINWDFLPDYKDKFGRDIIFNKSKLMPL